MADTGNSNAAVVGLYGALTYDVVAAACSSPQTTEINAATRADTLMKWVHLGLLQAAIFTAIGVTLQVQEGKPAWPPLLGSGLGGAMMYASYVHAKQAGLASGEPGTEDTGTEADTYTAQELAGL